LTRELHAARPGTRQTGHDEAADHTSLELGKRAGDSKEHPPRGRGRVNYRLLAQHQRR
jgi:hypothetical protein